MPISLHNVSFSYAADLDPILTGVSASLTSHTTAIIGRNGSGKTTLVRLLAGDHEPSSGTITMPETRVRLDQNLFATRGTVADLLGISPTLEALRRIEQGSVDVADFDAVGDNWDIEARALAFIAAHVPSLDPERVLERDTSTLSGGELVRLALGRATLARAEVTLLDEPTNNLDRAARSSLLELLPSLPGQVVVVSHDVELLSRVDAIVEISHGKASLFGGNWDLYTERRDIEREAALREVTDAKSALRAERKDFAHVQTATARQAKRDTERRATISGGPKLSDPTAKRAAEARRAGKVKAAATKVREAREKLQAAEESICDHDSISIPIVDPQVPASKTLATIVIDGRELHLGGTDRWAIAGANGSGKTTLLRRTIAASSARIGYLDQRLELPEGTVFDVVAGSAPDRPPHDTYEILASFRLRGEIVTRDVSTLSGGERFRVGLARLLLADPPHQLIVADEPTNNLDLDSIDQLCEALTSYRGALLVVSHDQVFLDRIGIERTITLGQTITF